MASFGVIMPAIRPPKTVPEDDNRTMQLRTRKKHHLEILRDEFMGDEMGPILHTPKFDYEYRAYCTPEAFGRAMAKMIVAIDYLKFKPTTDRYKDNELHQTYMRIWGVVHSDQSEWSYSKYSGTSYTPVSSGTGLGSNISKYKAPVYNPGTGGLPAKNSLYPDGNPNYLGWSNPYRSLDETVPDVASWVGVDIDTDLSGIDEVLREFSLEDFTSDNLPNIMTMREVAEFLREPIKMVRRFVKANRRWASCKNDAKGRYEFRKDDLIDIGTDFDAWYQEIASTDNTFTGGSR